MQEFMPEAAPTVDLEGRVQAISGCLRLAACPRCPARGRALTEHGDALVARCLGCGEEFSAPLATVEVTPSRLVGRGGQRVVDLRTADAA
jgi:hypothetical protein